MPRDLTLPRRLLIALALVLGCAASALGQGVDTEPNNTCQTAQQFGAVTLPFTVTGTLGTPGVDFFKFSAPPGSLIVLDLEGQPTGQGTLEDPLLGLFDSACEPLGFDDDSGQGLNAREGLTVPANGVFIVAVTACCDLDFAGAVADDGSYRLPLSAAGVIRGAIADSLGNAFFPERLLAFRPDGSLVASGPVNCCTDNHATYELFVPVGTYRVVAQSNLARVWHHDRPSFSQADPITVVADQQVNGIDFTLPRAARITPRLNQATFAPGDTLVLDLAVQNPSPTPASVRVVATALVPAEPAVSSASFCCFQDAITLFEQPSATIPALANTTVSGAVSYHFSGAEPAGTYNVCVALAQGRFFAQPCVQFTFTP